MRNVIFKRTCFNRRVQMDDKSAEQFIVELQNLAEFCNYGELKAEMICDRLVVGVRNWTFAAERWTYLGKSQASYPPTRSRSSTTTLKGGTNSASSDLDRLQSDSHNPSWQRTHSKPAKMCSRCGKEPHSREHCPARDATCNCCHKRGYYMWCCLTKNISKMSAENHLNTAFLDTVTDHSASSWKIQINLNGTSVCFKLGTGAEVMAISLDTFQILHNIQLTKSQKTLFVPSRAKLNVIGQFPRTFTYACESLCICLLIWAWCCYATEDLFLLAACGICLQGDVWHWVPLCTGWEGDPGNHLGLWEIFHILYILGKVFIIETDHKPLIPLFGEKSLDSLPPWRTSTSSSGSLTVYCILVLA